MRAAKQIIPISHSNNPNNVGTSYHEIFSGRDEEKK